MERTPLQTRILFDLQTRWLRPLLVLAVILGSAVLPYFFSLDRIQLLLMALVGAGVVLVFLRWPQLGIPVLIGGSLVFKYAIGTGTQTRLTLPVLILGLLIGLWIFHMVAHERRLHFAGSRTALPLAAFSAVTLLAFAVGQLPWFMFAQKASLAAQVGGLALFILSFGAYLLVGNQIRELRWLEAATWLFLALGALHIASLLVPFIGRLTDEILPSGILSGSLFWLWLVALAFSQALFNRDLHPFWRVALAGLVGATLFVSLGPNRNWASGWLPAIVAVAAILWARRSGWFWLAAAVGAAGFLWKLESVSGFFMGGDNQYSLVTRLAAWEIMARIIQVNPVLGLGPANYYWYTPLYPILGYSVQFNSHNNYIDILAQTGVLGLICFLWFAWEVWRLGWRMRSQAPAGFARAYVYGALGGLAGMLASGMLGDWVLPFVYNVGYEGFRTSVLGWIFLGGLMAIEQMGSGAESPESMEAPLA